MSGEWIGQLNGDLQKDERITSYKDMDLSGFAKTHLDVLGKLSDYEGKVKEFEGEVTTHKSKLTDLEGKLAKDYIPKLTANPTSEELDAYYAAIGRPGKPEEYEFPKVEGAPEHDPEMMKWSSDTFFKAGLTKSQASFIAQEYDKLQLAMDKLEEEAYKKAEEKAHSEFRSLFKTEDDYKAALELTTRVWKKVTDVEFDDFCRSTGLGNHPLLIKFIFNIARKTGEDLGPAGMPRRGDIKEGEPMQYPNSPAPPKNM
jgi:hypothetical protein